MSKFKVGMLVMLRSPLPLTLEEHGIVNGAIGEITSLVSHFPDSVTLLFPSYPSDTKSKEWHGKKAWLVPISNPDAELGNDTYMEFGTKVPVKEGA